MTGQYCVFSPIHLGDPVLSGWIGATLLTVSNAGKGDVPGPLTWEYF